MVVRCYEIWKQRLEARLEALNLDSTTDGDTHRSDIVIVWDASQPSNDTDNLEWFPCESKEYWLQEMERIWPDSKP